MARLARGPTSKSWSLAWNDLSCVLMCAFPVVWSKNNQEPWNTIQANQSTKLINVNEKLEKRSVLFLPFPYWPSDKRTMHTAGPVISCDKVLTVNVRYHCAIALNSKDFVALPSLSCVIVLRRPADVFSSDSVMHIL